MYSVYELLNKKRRGAPLESREIEYFIEGYTRGTIPDYQMSALLMATAINGMTAEEMATCPDCLGDPDTVCDACGQHSCWEGEFMCHDNKKQFTCPPKTGPGK